MNAEPVPADPRIEAAARAWVGDKQDGTNPMDLDDEFSAHNRVRMAIALAAADAVLTPPEEGDYGIYHDGKWVPVTLHVDPKDGSVKNVTTRDGAAVVSPPPPDVAFRRELEERLNADPEFLRELRAVVSPPDTPPEYEYQRVGEIVHGVEFVGDPEAKWHAREPVFRRVVRDENEHKK